MKLKELFNPKAGAISSLLAPHYLASESLFMTKQGALGAVYRIRGVDFECLTDDSLEAITHTLHTVLKNLDPAFRVYQYVIKRKGVNLAYHRAEKLFQYEVYWCLLYEPRQAGFVSRDSLKITQKVLDARIAEAEISLGNFEDTASSLLGLQRCASEEIFSFLQKLLFSSGELQWKDHLDYWAAQTAIDIHGRKIEVGQAVLPLSLRSLPSNTSPNQLIDLAKLPCDLILCSEFKRISAEKAGNLIKKSEEHFFFRKQNPDAKTAQKRRAGKETREDAVAEKTLGRLGDFANRVDEGEYVGEFSLRLILSGSNLLRHAAEAKSYAGNFEAELEADTFGALDSYLSIIPGNTSLNIHKQWNLSMNYADLALAYAPPVGDPVNKHLGKEALTILETTFGTPAYFNLHEDDLLGALIFGIMGSGKSFLTNLLVDRAQKYNPFTFILDIGGSYKHLALAHGGTFIALSKRRGEFTMNPFDCEKTEDNLDFLSAFVHVLLGESGYDPTPQECQEIDIAVKTASRLSDLKLSENLSSRLYNWMGTGRYAYLFDNEKDTLSLGSFQAFDFQGVADKVMEPLFFYIFQKISRIVYDPANIGRPKGIYCDEVWKLLKNQTARDWLVEAGKTFRKHNGGIVLTTQSALDMKKVGLLDVVNELCPTKIFLANPGSNLRLYKRIFKWNSRETRLFAGLEKKKQFLVKTPNRSAVLSYIPTAEEIALFSNDPNSNIRRDALIKELGYEKAMSILSKGDAA